MNYLQAVISSFTPLINKTIESQAWDLLYGTLKDNVDSVLNKPYSKSAIAYVCISTTAEAIGQVPILVMKKVGSPNQGMRRRAFLKVSDTWFIAQKTNQFEPTIAVEIKSNGELVQWEPVMDNHPWQALFNRPNYLMSMSAYTEAIVSYYMLHGNVWSVGYPSSPRTIPDAIWVTNKRTMEPKKNKQGHLIAWQYNPRGNTMFSTDSEMEKATIPIEDRICHIKMFNPDDPIMGLSPFEPAKMPLRTEWKAARYNEKVIDNDGTPGGSVMTDKFMAPPQVAEFRQQWREAHSGSDNAKNLAILHSGLKYQNIGVTMKSMEHMDLRKFTRDEIIQILKMKKAVISITEDLNYATHQGQIKAWWQTGNIPKIRSIETALSWQFLKNDPNLKIMYDLSTVEALQDDFKEKTEIARIWWSMGVSVDALNERLGCGFDSGMPGADTGYLPFSLAPAGMSIEPPQETPPQLPDESEEEEEEEEKQRLLPPIEVKFVDITSEAERKFQAWERRAEPIWKIVSNRVGRIEKPFEGKVQKVFFELRKNLLSVFHTGKPKKSKEGSIIIPKRLTEEAIRDINEYDAYREKLLLDQYAAGYFDLGITQGIDTILDELGTGDRIQMTDPFIVEYMRTKRTKITSVIDTVKHQIEHQMFLGAKEGEDVVKLEKRIKTVLNIANKRAHVIARTEMGGAMNFGRYAQINRSSFKFKIWFTALDERVRSEEDGAEYWHDQMHGERLEIGPNSKWAVPGKNGYDYIAYPGDYQGAAGNIINDRCIEVVDTET